MHFFPLIKAKYELVSVGNNMWILLIEYLFNLRILGWNNVAAVIYHMLLEEVWCPVADWTLGQTAFKIEVIRICLLIPHLVLVSTSLWNGKEPSCWTQMSGYSDCSGAGQRSANMQHSLCVMAWLQCACIRLHVLASPCEDWQRFIAIQGMAEWQWKPMTYCWRKGF